jgi:hypothetical protein
MGVDGVGEGISASECEPVEDAEAVIDNEPSEGDVAIEEPFRFNWSEKNSFDFFRFDFFRFNCSRFIV